MKYTALNPFGTVDGYSRILRDATGPVDMYSRSLRDATGPVDMYSRIPTSTQVMCIAA